jgi:hypothetical protein
MTRNLEIDCANYEINGGSVGHSLAGSVFRCTISPVAADMLGELDGAARSNGTVRLLFTRETLLLERIKIERVEPMSVRIVGRIVVSSSRREERLLAQSPDAKGLPR